VTFQDVICEEHLFFFAVHYQLFSVIKEKSHHLGY